MRIHTKDSLEPFVLVLCVAALVAMGCKSKPAEQTSEPNKVTDATETKGGAAAKLHGVWEVEQIVVTVNGKPEPAAKPRQPTTWTFAEDGLTVLQGAEQTKLTYVYEGDHLITNASGREQDYLVERMTHDELHLQTSVVATESIQVDSSSVLRRK